MKCPRCKIGDISARELEPNGKILVECSQCIGVGGTTYANIILYNYRLEQAELLGKRSFLDQKKSSDNPYKDQALREAWEHGFEDFRRGKIAENIGGEKNKKVVNYTNVLLLSLIIVGIINIILQWYNLI